MGSYIETNMFHGSACLPCQTAHKMKRFCDSLLQKTGKLRALLRDLRENYEHSDETKQSLDQSRYMIGIIGTHVTICI